jgi:uncharacterized membrane protein YfcA
MIGFEQEVLILFGGVFFLAAFIHGSTGFGFPMVATPLLALISDIHTAILLTLIPTFVVNLVTISSEGDFRGAVRQHLPLALLAMAGAAFGTVMLIVSKPDFFEALLGIAIISYLLATRINLRLTWIRAYPRAAKTVFGLAAGILGGLTNVMAPVLIVYALESRYSKNALIQASNMCFLSGKIIQLILFSAHGSFGVRELSTSVIMILFVVLALAVGVQIRKRIHVVVYMKILRAFLLILALSLLYKAAF